jgi:hypothetical protein
MAGMAGGHAGRQTCSEIVRSFGCRGKLHCMGDTKRWKGAICPGQGWGTCSVTVMPLLPPAAGGLLLPPLLLPPLLPK